MEENKNPLMGHVVKVPAQVSGIPDGVQMTVNAAVTTFAAVDGKPAGIESMGTAECNMLASYTRGTVSFSVHGEKPVMVSVRLDELMRLLQAAAAHHACAPDGLQAHPEAQRRDHPLYPPRWQNAGNGGIWGGWDALTH